MAVLKKKVRKKLAKYLTRLVKKHGAEMTLALVSGIVGSIAAESPAKDTKKARVRKGAARPPVRTIVVRKRATR